MRPVAPLGAMLILLLIALAPASQAEYGPESEDGWPINVDGKEIKPPVTPQMLVEYAGPLNKVGPVTAYPYYPILTLELMRLADEYPHLVQLQSAGKSVAGLDIWLLEIGDFDNPDRIPFEEREVVYIDGGIHSNEYSGVYFLTEIAQFLIEDYEDNETAKWIVENRHVFLAPMVNPDGSNAFGRMNAHWVNLNRNFPYTWGELDEDIVFNNPGDEPASEPETRIVIDLVDTLRPDYFGSIHCCGNLWLHPWGAEHLADPADMQMFSRTCDELFADIRDRCGPIWSTIYPAAGSSVDEAYGRIGSAAWGFEMSGRGAISLWGQPAIIDDVRHQERESWAAVMHAFLNVHKYGAHPEVVSVEGTTQWLDVTIKNTGWGPLVAGNLTLGTNTIALPEIPPAPQNESSPSNVATVRVVGDHRPGETTLALDWTKRVYTTPQGEKAMAYRLEERGERLVGVQTDGRLDAADTDPVIESSPAGWLGLVVLATTAAALAVAGRKRHHRDDP